MKFTKAESAKRFIKAAFYGAAGSGKTIAALSAPGIKKMIDTDGSGPAYAALADFEIMPTQSFGEIKETLDDLVLHPPKEETTLIIDSASLIWQGLQAAMLEKKLGEKGIRVMEGTEKVQFSLADWGILKRWNRDIFNGLMTLKCHVVCTFRETETMEEFIDERGCKNFRKTGVYVPQWEKDTPYIFDHVARLVDRKAAWTKGRRVEDGKLIDMTGRKTEIPTVSTKEDLPKIWQALFGVQTEKPTQANPLMPQSTPLALEKDPEACRKGHFIRSQLLPKYGISDDDLQLYLHQKTKKDSEDLFFDLDIVDNRFHLSKQEVAKLDWLINVLESEKSRMMLLQKIEELKKEKK